MARLPMSLEQMIDSRMLFQVKWELDVSKVTHLWHAAQRQGQQGVGQGDDDDDDDDDATGALRATRVVVDGGARPDDESSTLR